MEACKTDGIFKQTCEKIMKILRNNKESILVIIEAFRYDPLIGWKITSKEGKED
jgi:FKBP12-rapamycin complex-associated protein